MPAFHAPMIDTSDLDSSCDADFWGLIQRGLPEGRLRPMYESPTNRTLSQTRRLNP
jgi:hypothetical protein